MIRIGSLLVAFVLAMVLSPATARASFPEILAPVTDLAGVIPESAEAQISQRLEEHREATNVHIAVLTIDTTRGMPIEDYALRVASQWGGGTRGVDDGALFVLAVGDRQMRLELGYGLEAQIPDAQARRLLDAAIPHLKNDDHANATHVVVEGVIGMTGGTSNAAQTIVASDVDPIETRQQDVWVPPGPVELESPRRHDDFDFAFSGFLVLAIGIGAASLGVVFRQAANGAQLVRTAESDAELPVDHIEMPPMGMWLLVLVGIVVLVGAIGYAVGFGIPPAVSAVGGGAVGYFILPMLAHTNAFSGTGTSSSTSTRSSSPFWSSRSSSFGSSFGRSSSIGSSSRSWGGGGGRFGGGGASSRW
jgi:uncharacterized protein